MSATDRRDFYVYALFDERANIIYVGKGKDRRLDAHQNSCRLRQAGLKNSIFLRVIAALGEIPRAKLADNLTRSEALSLERIFIKAIGRFPDGPLLNATPGGQGGGAIPSPESRAKRSRSLRGRVINQKTREAVARANARRVVTPEIRKKISDGVKRARPGNGGVRRARGD